MEKLCYFLPSPDQYGSFKFNGRRTMNRLYETFYHVLVVYSLGSHDHGV